MRETAEFYDLRAFFHYTLIKVVKEAPRDGNSLMALLKIAHFKERPWAIRSCRSWTKSDLSDSIFFTMLFLLQKTSESLEKPMS